ncbi:hypothetical protein BX666DRAFT_1912864 [Dichotomocladium elegans]|nr:hypothetical protein BX666DRAFT_1912864 [Dichotomocladium elegans]
MGQDFSPDMEMGIPGMPRMPLLNPAFQGGFGGPEEMWSGGMGPMPGMPPPDGMMPFNPMAFNPRGGFGGSSRGRGGARGGRIYPNMIPRRRGDQPPGEGEGSTTTSGKRERGDDEGEPAERAATAVDMAGPDEAIPTAPRADRERYAQSQGRYRPSSSRSHRRRSRTPSRSRSPRRDTHHRRRSPSRSRSRSPKRSSRRRSPSESRSQSGRRSSTVPQDEKSPTSPRSHRDRHSSSRSHRSSRHHSSKYRSRERESERSRDRSGDRSGDKSRRRDRR